MGVATKVRPTPRLTVGAPSLGGHRPVQVGRRVYGIPAFCAVAHSTLHGHKLVYILEGRGGTVHVFTESGEVGPLGEALQQMVRNKIFNEPLEDATS